MMRQLSREDCLQALKTKTAEAGRLPRKSDYTEYEVSRIKAFFGPWPRALEAAGLIPAKSEDRLAKNMVKRINAKQKKSQSTKKK
jgi:hypothetical protein